MKKLMIVIVMLIASIGVKAQFNVEGINVVAYDVLEAEDVFILGGDSVNSTTQVSSTDTTLTTKDYVDGKAAGLDSIQDIDTDYICKIYLNGDVVDEFKIDSTYHSVYSDSSKFADNSTYSDTATVALNTVDQTVYTITLPVNSSSLSESATACTDKPDGWILTAVGENLYIEHNMGKYYSNIMIKYNYSGDIYKLLRPFYGAFQNITDTDNNNIIIEGITEDYKTSKIQIKLSF